MDKNQEKSPVASDEEVFDDTVEHLEGHNDDATSSGNTQLSTEKVSSVSLPNTTLFKIATQMSRYDQLCRIGREVEELHGATTTQGVIEGKMALLSELWSKFTVDHESLGVGCRTTLFKHHYMTTKIYERALETHYKAISSLYELKSQAQALATQNTISGSLASSSFQQATLPEIKLPIFSGDSSTWPAFRDLFTSLVHDRVDLKPVSKLYYLKTNLTGPPAQLLLNVQMTDTAYGPAWEQLKDRYDDPELLIFAHIHNLFNAPSASAKSPAQLDHLVGTVRQNLDALTALEVQVKHTDYFLVYLISNKLDASLREAWEIKRTSPDVQTTVENLLRFISQAAAHQSTQWPTQSTAGRTQPVQRQTSLTKAKGTTCLGVQRKADYPCDFCFSYDHFLANCRRFLEQDEADRYKLVVSSRLCFNCLGHHSIQACQSKKNCSKCNQRHHTLIHDSRLASLKKRGYGPGQQPQPTLKADAAPSTSK